MAPVLLSLIGAGGPRMLSIAAREADIVSVNPSIDPFSAADLYFMGNILHDWNESEKLALISKAYEALPAGGMLVAIENVIDAGERRDMDEVALLARHMPGSTARVSRSGSSRFSRTSARIRAGSCSWNQLVHSRPGMASFPSLAVYADTKAGLTNAASSIRPELVRTPIHTTIVAPGPVDTQMWDNIEES